MQIYDLSKYSTEKSEITKRKLFNNSEDLRLFYLVINNHQPVSIPELRRQFNRIFGTSHDKSWFYTQFQRIEGFSLYNRLSYGECKPNGVAIEVEIIQKHKEWLINQPPYFHRRYDIIEYYYLNSEGVKWADEVNKMQKKFRGV